MRILVLTKRQYMNRDLIDDLYGRFRELPLALASKGLQVSGLCLSYRPRPEGMFLDSFQSAYVAWKSLNISKLFRFDKGGYWGVIDRFAASMRPDLIWACSDVLHSILGARTAQHLNAKLVIDFYDNFESYGLTRLPGMRKALRDAVRVADGVSCVTSSLEMLIRERYHYSGPIKIIQNAVPDKTFRPIDRYSARSTLNLPQEATLIGTAGSLARSRGMSTLFQAYEQLSQERPNVHLVLAGTRDKGLVLPTDKRVHYLGILPPDQVPYLLSSLNVSVICNRESDFGNYCFPQKLYESIACKVPTVVAATQSMKEFLHDFPEVLFKPDDITGLVLGLRRQIDYPKPIPLTAPTWHELGGLLSCFFNQILSPISGQSLYKLSS